jgi:hypothetical protein
VRGPTGQSLTGVGPVSPLPFLVVHHRRRPETYGVSERRDRHVIGVWGPTWRVSLWPPARSLFQQPRNSCQWHLPRYSGACPLSLSSFIDLLAVSFEKDFFPVGARHSHFVPHRHRPFAWLDHPSTRRVIACALLWFSLHRRSLWTLERPSRGRRQRAWAEAGAPGHEAPARQRPRGSRSHACLLSLSVL